MPTLSCVSITYTWYHTKAGKKTTDTIKNRGNTAYTGLTRYEFVPMCDIAGKYTRHDSHEKQNLFVSFNRKLEIMAFIAQWLNRIAPQNTAVR